MSDKSEPGQGPVASAATVSIRRSRLAVLPAWYDVFVQKRMIVATRVRTRDLWLTGPTLYHLSYCDHPISEPILAYFRRI